jgi:menaquinone-dependent protoporphyrinogen oxidase
MSILVAYASRYGATKGIAERIAVRIAEAGQHVDARPIDEVGALDGYDAFVIGSAAYFGAWGKQGAEFVRRNQTLLAAKPLWLFSSGPLGTERTDARGQDKLFAAEPREFVEFRELLEPRGTQVFFGAFDPRRLGFFHRLIARMPAARKAGLFPEGDFRDWAAIEAWADAIAHDLAPAATPGR